MVACTLTGQNSMEAGPVITLARSGSIMILGILYYYPPRKVFRLNTAKPLFKVSS